MNRTAKVLRNGALCAVLAFASLIGCNSNDIQSYATSVQAFNLETVMGLLKTNQVKNADDLQQAVNDPASGINNVDIDNDRQVDFIGVREQRVNQYRTDYVFEAVPSSRGGTVIVASVSISVSESQVTVTGNYPQYVSGWNDAYYTYSVARGPTFSDWLFVSWMLSSRPVYAYGPVGSYGWYRPRAVYAPSVLQSTRTTYTTTTKVGPIPRQAPPSGYTGNYGTKDVSRYARPTPQPSDTSLSSRSGSMRNYTVTSPTAPKPTGSSLGSSSSTSRSSSSTSSSSYRPPSSSSSSFSRPASKPSSSFSRPSSGSSSSFGRRK